MLIKLFTNIKILLSLDMKLLQNLLEEKSTNLKVLKLMGKFLIDLSDKIDKTNDQLEKLNSAVGNQQVVEKTIIQTSEVSTQEQSPIKTITTNPDDEFIPGVGDSDLEVSTKSNSTTVVNKDFADAAASLKEE